jgi:hypothetical protein
LRHPDTAKRRINIESIAKNPVTDLTDQAIEQIGGYDLKIVVADAGKGALAISVPHRSDASNLSRQVVADLDLTALISSDTSLIETEIVGIGHATCGDQNIRPCDQSKAEVFDYVEGFYNPSRRHSTLRYLSPMDFEKKAGIA